MILSQLFFRASLVFSGRIVGAAVTFVTHVMLARWMGEQLAGKYAYAFSLCMVAAAFASLGISSATQRIVGASIASDSPGTIKIFLSWAQRCIFSAAVLLAVLVSAGNYLTSSASFSPTVYFAMLMLPFWCLVRLHSAIAQAFSWLPLMVLPNTVVRPALFLCSITIWFTANGSIVAAEAMIMHMFLVIVVSMVQFWIVRTRVNALGDEIDISLESRWLLTSVPLLLVSLSVDFYPEFSTVIIGIFVPPDEIAYFNSAFRIAFLIAFLLSAVDAITMPRVAQKYASGGVKEVEKVILQATYIKTLASFCGVIALGFKGDWMLQWFGDSFVAAHSTLVWLSVSLLIRSACGPGLEILAVTGHQMECLKVCACNLMLTGISLAVASFVFGIQGASVAIVIVTIVMRVWCYLLVKKRIGLSIALFSKYTRKVS